MDSFEQLINGIVKRLNLGTFDNYEGGTILMTEDSQKMFEIYQKDGGITVEYYQKEKNVLEPVEKKVLAVEQVEPYIKQKLDLAN